MSSPVLVLYVYVTPFGNAVGKKSNEGGNVVEISKLTISSLPRFNKLKLKPRVDPADVGFVPELKTISIGFKSGAQTSTERPNKYKP